LYTLQKLKIIIQKKVIFPVYYLGIPLPLSISPLLQQTTMLGPRMNMMERATNIWQFALSWYSVIQTLRKVLIKNSKKIFKNIFKENELFRSYISPDFPSLDKVLAEVDLAFVYNDEFLDPALPTLPKVFFFRGKKMEVISPHYFFRLFRLADWE